ncbi:Protein cft1 [Dissostichus eleginoides]|uniref:Protein cft1 n=1 Tax=Dissostichus eleginoides TaxID=100907 RepID=A0AAD9B5C5_DISEL|nr:Protein cft1 [Dissostichus eleginoides]
MGEIAPPAILHSTDINRSSQDTQQLRASQTEPVRHGAGGGCFEIKNLDPSPKCAAYFPNFLLSRTYWTVHHQPYSTVLNKDTGTDPSLLYTLPLLLLRHRSSSSR